MLSSMHRALQYHVFSCFSPFSWDNDYYTPGNSQILVETNLPPQCLAGSTLIH